MEKFQPRCWKNEVIVMRRATYGRMRIGKCIEAEEDVLANGNDPRYLGCSVDVLDILDNRCSGEAQCDVSVNDQELGNTKPCYKSLRMHLEASYSCAGGELHSSVASGNDILSSEARPLVSLHFLLASLLKRIVDCTCVAELEYICVGYRLTVYKIIA